MPLVEKLDVAPQAGVMFVNLLGYLVSGQCYRQLGQTAMLAPPASGLQKMLDDNRIIYQDLGSAFDKLAGGKFQNALVDASLLTTPAVLALRQFAADGGHVMIHRATPAQEKDLCALAGIRLRLLPVDKEPLDIRNRVLRGQEAGLLAGITNQELAWLSNAYLANLHCEGNWWSYFNKMTPEEHIADYFCQPGDDAAAKCSQLTCPGGAGAGSPGQGLRAGQPVAPGPAGAGYRRAGGPAAGDAADQPRLPGPQRRRADAGSLTAAGSLRVLDDRPGPTPTAACETTRKRAC